MAALVGDHRFKGKILRIGVALERLGIEGQQILFGCGAPAILRAARLAVNVAILDAPDKPQFPRDAGRTVAAGTPFRRSQRARRGCRHEIIVATLHPRAEHRCSATAHASLTLKRNEPQSQGRSVVATGSIQTSTFPHFHFPNIDNLPFFSATGDPSGVRRKDRVRHLPIQRLKRLQAQNNQL
jgi:hypothetical protein